MIAVIQRVFFERGIRFVFSTRSKVPWILNEDGTRFFEGNYQFVPGKDEVIAEGTAGYVISFGEMLYRSWDAVLRCRKEGLDVGLINKPTLNIVDEEVSWPFPVHSTHSSHECRGEDHQEGWKFAICPHRRILQPKYWCK